MLIGNLEVRLALDNLGADCVKVSSMSSSSNRDKSPKFEDRGGVRIGFTAILSCLDVSSASSLEMDSVSEKSLDSRDTDPVSKFNVPLKVGRSALTHLTGIDEILDGVSSGGGSDCLFLFISIVVQSEAPILSFRCTRTPCHSLNDFLVAIAIANYFFGGKNATKLFFFM